jgi:protein TonB
MNSIDYNIWSPRNVAFVVAITALINALLFAGLPWLTRVADRERDTKMVTPYLLTPRREPKMVDSEKEKRLRREELKKPPKPKSRSSSAKREMNAPKFGFEFGEGGFGQGVAVGGIDTAAFGLDMDEFGFDLSQVDKAPRIIRRVTPMYPFSAKRKGLSGWVMIKCLVGKDGLATKIAAVDSQPKDILDVFGPACVEAVKKYRFSPGEIGGDPVPTRVAFRIIFELES